MADGGLASKLQIKSGYRIAVINAPSGYLDELGTLPDGVTLLDKPKAPLDFAQLFVKTRQELDNAIPVILKELKKDGLLWVCYPKGTAKIATELNRDKLWEAMNQYGMAGVSLVSLNNVWSAMRFRPADKVGK